MSVQSFTLPVPKVKKKRWGKPKPGESLKMLAAGSLAFAKAYSSVEKLEHELEVEIQRDKDPKRGKGIHKWRRKGGKFILGKYFLIFIVVINIIDCGLILGELILDLHHVKDILFEQEQLTANFLQQLDSHYPGQFSSYKPSQIEDVYGKILQSRMLWPNGHAGNMSMSELIALVGSQDGTSFIVKLNTTELAQNGTSVQQTNEIWNQSSGGQYIASDQVPVQPEMSVTHDATKHATSSNFRKDVKQESVLGIVGNAFHKTSLTISVILTTWVVLKILCFGRHLLDRKLEVFDTIVILTSFIVDMIFVKGLAMYSLQEFVFILAFMLPWRVIRVTNSLVVAVKDHEHIRLKMLFTQKKKIEHENKQIRSDRDNYREQVEVLKKLCLAEGIDDWKIFQSLARQPVRPGSKGAMGSFASLAFGFGNKSTSFWSVLGTPKMRRGKSMEQVDNRIVNSDTLSAPVKRHSKGRILSFLGSSTDFFRGKIKNGHHNYSLESDPGMGIANSYLRNSGNVPNGNVNTKRLVRGETIDTGSTDSLDKVCEIDDYSRQETIDSSTFDAVSTTSHLSESAAYPMQRTLSESNSARPPMTHSRRVAEDPSPHLLKPRSASVNETLGMHTLSPQCSKSDDLILETHEDV